MAARECELLHMAKLIPLSDPLPMEGPLDGVCLSQQVDDLLRALELEDCSKPAALEDLKPPWGVQDDESGRTTSASCGDVSGSGGVCEALAPEVQSSPRTRFAGATPTPTLASATELSLDLRGCIGAVATSDGVSSRDDGTRSLPSQTQLPAEPAEHAELHGGASKKRDSESLDDLLLALGSQSEDLLGDHCGVGNAATASSGVDGKSRLPGGSNLTGPPFEQQFRPPTATLEDLDDEWDMEDGHIEVDNLLQALQFQEDMDGPAASSTPQASAGLTLLDFFSIASPPRAVVSPTEKLDAIVTEAEGLLMALDD